MRYGYILPDIHLCRLRKIDLVIEYLNYHIYIPRGDPIEIYDVGGIPMKRGNANDSDMSLG